MKQYEVIPSSNQYYTILKLLNHSDYKVLILYNSYDLPNIYLTEIQTILKHHSIVKCKVLLDFLLTIGNTDERYTEVLFDEKKFVNGTFKEVVIGKKDIVRKISTHYLKEHINLLENSILHNYQVDMMKNGIAI